MKRTLIKLRNRLTGAGALLAELQALGQGQGALLTALQQHANGLNDANHANNAHHDANARQWAEAAQQRGALRDELAALQVNLVNLHHDLAAQQAATLQAVQQATTLQAVQRAQAALETHLVGMGTGLEAVNGRLARMERWRVESPVAAAQHHGSARQPVHVHFFFQVPQIWSTWESVWRACTDSPDIEATLVLLPFLHASAGDPSRARRFLAERHIPFVDWSAYRLNEEQPDLVFLQNPYDSTRPPELAVECLLAHGVRIAYIPYGLDVGGGQDNLRWQYDLAVQRHAWRVFVRSEEHRRMYALHCSAGNRRVVVTGHPKIDNIVTRCGPLKRPPPSDGARKTVLWCPHFSVEGGGWSTFMALHEAILGFFESRPPDLRLIVRPHPLFFGRLAEISADGGLTESRLRQRFRQPPWIDFDEAEDYGDVFLQSDALMTDAGSFLLEYLPTEKPILYLHNPDGPGLNESATFVDAYDRASEFAAVTDFLEKVRRGEDARREERLSRIQELLHRVDGTVGQHIVAHIAAQWKAKPLLKPLERASGRDPQDGSVS